MADQARPTSSEPLQFDRVIANDSIGSVPRDRAVASCEICGNAIDTDYYHVNSKVTCESCRAAVEAALETPRGVMTLLRAGAYGLGAGIFGAIVYYGVIALLNLEVGIVAILIGYMVGYATRTGAGGRGGRRFQVLAVALTYASIALAYTPLVFTERSEQNAKNLQTAQSLPAPAAGDRREAVETGGAETKTSKPGGPAQATNPIVALGLLLLLIAALPVMIVFGSLPSGLISAAIIFFGMSQAWKMTGVPKVEILGPYRVGAAASATAQA